MPRGGSIQILCRRCERWPRVDTGASRNRPTRRAAPGRSWSPTGSPCRLCFSTAPSAANSARRLRSTGEAFTRDGASEVLGILEELGVSPCINVDEPGRDVVLGDRQAAHPKHLVSSSRGSERRIRGLPCRRLTVLAFTFVGGEPSSMRDLAAELTARAPVAASVYVDRTYGGLGLSLRPPGTNKWDGVVAYCARPRARCEPRPRDRRLGERPGATRWSSGRLRRR